MSALSMRRLSTLSAWTMVLLFASVLTLYRIGFILHSGITLFVDEAQYWDWSRHPDWGYYSKPPVIAWLIALATRCWGNGVVAIKSVGLITYALMAFVLKAFGDEMLEARTGSRAALAWLSLPLVGGLSLFASTDGPLMLCWVGAAWMLWRAQSRDRWSDWLTLGLCVGLGLLSKYTMAAFVFTAAWALWQLPGPRRGLMRVGPWLALIVALGCLAPNLLWNARHGFPTLHHTQEITTGSTRSGGVLEALKFLAAQWLFLGPLSAGLMVMAFGRTPLAPTPAGAPMRPDHDARRYALALSLPLLVLAAVQAARSHANANWAAPAFVGLVLLAVIGLRHSARPGHWFTAWVLSNLALTAVVLYAPDWARWRSQPPHFHTDILVRMRGWDQVLARMRNLAPTDLPVACDSRPWLAQIAYQWRDLNVHPYAWNPQHLVSDHYQMTTDLNAVRGQDVLLLSESGDAQPLRPYARSVDDLGSVDVITGPQRHLTLHAYVLRGFLGY